MSPSKLLAGGWTIVILALCWTPAWLLPVREDGPKKPLPIPIDKVVHLGIFAIFAILWMVARRSGGLARAGWVLLAGLALAVVSELGQEMPIVSRDANLADGLADALGVVAGLGAFAVGSTALGRIKPAGLPPGPINVVIEAPDLPLAKFKPPGRSPMP